MKSKIWQVALDFLISTSKKMFVVKDRFETSVTIGMIRIGSFAFKVEQYLFSRNIAQNQIRNP